MSLSLPVAAVLLYSIAGAALLVYIPFLVVAYGRLQVGYDSRAPRAVFEKLPPYAQRATWAHQNSFESFMLFAAAALMAYVTQQDSIWVAGAAIAYLVARLLFSLFYILDIPLGRSLMFGLGTLCIATLMGTSLTSLH
ncbi:MULTISPECIES: MAPEG family protein [Trichocoleus]|uniref:MAPEG family protein n=1 Tax=Trichocoleus desertorum GB2-A4 TaxID=2933944 RepID=A0ABV0J1V0_9CYAN|nr:MAPEG family protein [Trichocoleus sp. FACHB-46]MBD1860348.1 MAPEG family protein [Trichocoleus sp. FACHB-46]